MSNQKIWSDLVDDSYIENFSKSLTQNDFNKSPVYFSQESFGGLPLKSKKKKDQLKIVTFDSCSLTKEFISENSVSLFIKNEKDLIESENYKNIYFASSVNLNPLKLNLLKLSLDKNIDFGIDSLSLGLWQSKLFRSQIQFKEIKPLLKSQHRLFRVSNLAYDMSGADFSQQLAIMLNSCVQQIQDYEGVLTPKEVFELTSFEVSLGSNTLMNVVKLQSLRILLDQLKNVYQVSTLEPSFIVTVASPRYMGSRELWNNILRLTSVNMSSIMGGADAHIYLPFDLFHKSTQFRNARNIDLILQNESFLNQVQYPLLGSYTLDETCKSLCQSAWDFFKEIENKEGLRKTLRSGWLQKEIEQANQVEIDLYLKRNKKMTGVNDFVLTQTLSEENPIPKKSETIDIQKWWDQFFFDEENEKLCDVEKLVPEQISSFFENWQFLADQLKEKGQSNVINLAIEPGQEKAVKVSTIKNIINSAGCEVCSLTKNPSTCPVIVVVASDPDGTYVDELIEKFGKDDQYLILWGGDKMFEKFDGFMGLQSNLLELYSLILKKMGAI